MLIYDNVIYSLEMIIKGYERIARLTISIEFHCTSKFKEDYMAGCSKRCYIRSSLGHFIKVMFLIGWSIFIKQIAYEHLK